MENDFTGQWAILPAMVRYDKELPANAKLIYAEIASKINEVGFCFCHNKHFSSRFGIKPDTVSSLIKRLEDAGYIRIDVDSSRINADRRRIYLTSKPYAFDGGIGFKSGTGNKSEGVSDLNPIPLENSKPENIPPIIPQGGSAKKQKRGEPKKQPDWKPDRFAGFWDFYPRHTSKQAAIKAWDKLKPSDELIAVIGKALRRQKASEEWQNGIGIPYASTYLNNQRWTDEADPLPMTGTERQPEGPEVQVWS